MASKFKAVFQLLRVRQYYKNLILFIGVFFAGKLFEFPEYPRLLLGFFLICLSSSLVYILNDIMDIESDKIHSEKMLTRPLANGTLSKMFAWILFFIIFGIEIGFIIYFKNLFSIMIVLVFLNGVLYNFVLKQIAFADIICLSTTYIWRALAGCAILNVRISPWLTITVFLTALLLATGKRIADFDLLGSEDASKHKKTYDEYSSALLNNILIIVGTALFIMYTLYCVLGPQESDSIVPLENQGLLVFSTPFALFLIIRYIYLIHAKPIIARNAEKLITDKPMVIGSLTLGILVLSILYLEIGTWDFFIL
ncbi:UbiA family prenyltransferase [Candidatus Lokiarchaeum ossiferum]|uniref:UbiA family prenyltransferase n=1 Tax=Candidatus Lokiarchaeum ossiferum TaxID=2951803 RepID=UPI00352ED158